MLLDSNYTQKYLLWELEVFGVREYFIIAQELPNKYLYSSS